MNQYDTQPKKWIKLFWDRCGKDGHKWYRSSVSPAETLEMLILLGSVIVAKPHEKARERFDVIKRKRHSLTSHKVCFICNSPGEVRHHIIWLKHGGLNSKKNLVTLCRPCHAKVHPWLA